MPSKTEKQSANRRRRIRLDIPVICADLRTDYVERILIENASSRRKYKESLMQDIELRRLATVVKAGDNLIEENKGLRNIWLTRGGKY